MLKRIFSVMLTLCMMLSFVTAFAEESVAEPVVKENKRVALDFESEDWVLGQTYTPSATTWITGLYINDNCNYVIEREDGRGNYLSFAGGQASNGYTMFGINGFSQDKIQFKFDLKTTTATGIDFRVRRTTPTNESSIHKINNGKFEGKTISANTWYTFCFTFDFANEVRSVTVHDAAGDEVYSSAEISYPWGSYTNVTHLRMFSGASAGTVSVDNVELTEWINWPAVESIKDSAGSTAVDYNTNSIVIGMSKQMVASEEHITITRDIDGSTVEVTAAELDTADKKNIILTLGTPLQSASTYTVTLAENMQMSFRSLEIGEAIVKKFTTAAREADMTGATFTPAAGSVGFTAELINATDTDKAMMVLVTSFDSSGRLFKTAFVPVTVLAGTAAGSPALAPTVNVEVPEGGSVKAFVLGDMLTFSPLNNNIHTFSLE